MKSVGPREEPWGNPALTGYASEDFHQEPIEALYYRENI